MSNPGRELASTDFSNLIGGPLRAVIQAQAQSSQTSVDFIKEVGFKAPDPNAGLTGGDEGTSDPIYVSFKYPKEISPYIPAVAASEGVDAVAATAAVYETHEIRVPILTMMPIPFIRIEEATVDFNAKITSMTYAHRTVTKTRKGSGGFSLGFVSLKAAASTKRVSRTGNTETKTYTMAVHVRAVQDEMPAGMEKLLGILEEAITSTPTT